jgi:malate dehydrogenase (oxaloacetate-decarboxylating)
MEGKALLYKYLGGVDGTPIMLDTKDPGAIINTVLMLQPGLDAPSICHPTCLIFLLSSGTKIGRLTDALLARF